MPKRQFNYRERLFGVKCWFCKKRVRVRAKVANHHIDGNKNNNRRENQEWVCLACHEKINKIQQTGRPLKTTGIQLTKSGGRNVRACVDKGGQGAINETTETIRKSKVMRPLFKIYLIIRLIEGRSEVEDICNSFPMFVEKEYGLIGWGSDRTCRRYLNYLCSSEGDFRLESTTSGVDIVKFKHPEDYEHYKGTKLPKTLMEISEG